MSGASSLQKGVLNLATMRSHDLQLFVDILRSARSANGQIDLVFDPSLSGPLGLVLEMPALIEQGTAKIYYLGMPIPNPHPALLWVLRPDTKLTHTLVSCISKCPPGIKHVCETLLSLLLFRCFYPLFILFPLVFPFRPPPPPPSHRRCALFQGGRCCATRF